MQSNYKTAHRHIPAAKHIVEVATAIMAHEGLTPHAISVLGRFILQAKNVLFK